MSQDTVFISGLSVKNQLFAVGNRFKNWIDTPNDVCLRFKLKKLTLSPCFWPLRHFTSMLR